MNAVLVFFACVCLFGGTMADDPVKVIFTRSNSSAGSKGGLSGCKPLSVPGAKVRFQALRTGGVEYTRMLVPSERMTASDVVATNSNSKNIAECAKAATEKKWDAFSFANGQCVGYKIGDGICLCTKGDFVLYLTKGAIRRPSSAKAEGRAAAAPPPFGYIRKIIYPTLNMTGDNFRSTDMSCEAFIGTFEFYPPMLLHTANGNCYYTNAFSPNSCNDPCAGTAMEVLIRQFNRTRLYVLSKCGETITLPMSDLEMFVEIYSHEGYGCIPYSDPASDDICEMTVIGPTGTNRMIVDSPKYPIDIDESPADTCDGDELYLYPGPADGSPCFKKETISTGYVADGNTLTIRFQRKPAYNKNSFNKGFTFYINPSPR